MASTLASPPAAYREEVIGECDELPSNARLSSHAAPFGAFRFGGETHRRGVVLMSVFFVCFICAGYLPITYALLLPRAFISH